MTDVKSVSNSVLSSHDNAVLNKIFNPNLPFDDDTAFQVLTGVAEDETPEVAKAKSLEVEGVDAAEKGDTSKALKLLTEAIHIAPHRSSGYNNRAQAFQLAGDTDAAVEDLNKAIELCGKDGNVACQAFTQRGIIHKFKGNESESLADFKAAAKLGGEFAKQQVIAMNPYAAMCNQMLSEVMGKIKSGEIQQ